MEELSTTRLRLRRWTTDAPDVDFLVDLHSRWEVMRYIGRWPRVASDRSEAVRRAERYAGMDHPVHGIWAIEDVATGRLHGTLLLKDLPASGAPVTSPDPAPSGDTEIGWHLHPDAWGHGYASEAAARVLEHAFAHGLDQVLAVTHPDNAASQRVARRIGMTGLGITGRYYDTTCALFRIDRPTEADPAG
ncbi:N-acetyltransferase [Tersicoccus solisilvae]|uniref:N-acetyltransferase n=1 Tax=Tersicoccus solisilvae TaxID=1882339 RepID=A0ABQ1NV05_9MICC|nr:GNAT family N-acetyltransferase [Tersicoccus solisilvae]GGC85736.1 N-acetyltransferase [Tersicoccus solisilvae]